MDFKKLKKEAKETWSRLDDIEKTAMVFMVFLGAICLMMVLGL